MGPSCLPPGHTSVTIDWPTACPVLYHRLPISICMTSVVYYCVKYSPPAGLATWDSNTGLILLSRLFLTYFKSLPFLCCTVWISPRYRNHSVSVAELYLYTQRTGLKYSDLSPVEPQEVDWWLTSRVFAHSHTVPWELCQLSTAIVFTLMN